MNTLLYIIAFVGLCTIVVGGVSLYNFMFNDHPTEEEDDTESWVCNHCIMEKDSVCECRKKTKKDKP